MENKTHLSLTEREKEIFAYILGYVVDNGISPTREEIAEKFKFSLNAAQKFVQSLCDKGRITILKKEGKRINRNIVIRNVKK